MMTPCGGKHPSDGAVSGFSSTKQMNSRSLRPRHVPGIRHFFFFLQGTQSGARKAVARAQEVLAGVPAEKRHSAAGGE